MLAFPFVRNAWYVAAWSSEIGRQLTERWLLDEPLVLYRTENGQAMALGDRCAHRRYPLAHGRLIGDHIECAYHGFTFDSSGACVAIPSQDHIPAGLGVRCYPVVERSGWAWVWMGAPSLADESQIPDCQWLDDPVWNTVSGTIELNCRYQLMNDNLLDLSHLSFVHTDTIGAGYIARSPVKCELHGQVVSVSREMNAVDLPPLHAKTMGLQNPVDRWQVEEFFPPSYHLVSSGSRSLGDGKVAESRVLNALTPNTHATTTYFWAVCFNYPIEPVSMRESQLHLLHQDAGIVEAQELMVASDPDGCEYTPAADAGVIRGRRLLQELIEAEQNVPV